MGKRPARDQRSPEAERYRRLYRLAAWRGHRRRDGTYTGGARQAALIRDSFQCRMCGRLLAGEKGDDNAPEVDHIKDHKGDLDLFLDLENLQSLCARPCHASRKRGEQKRGYSTEVGEDGWPVSFNHPVNRVG